MSAQSMNEILSSHRLRWCLIMALGLPIVCGTAGKTIVLIGSNLGGLEIVAYVFFIGFGVYILPSIFILGVLGKLGLVSYHLFFEGGYLPVIPTMPIGYLFCSTAWILIVLSIGTIHKFLCSKLRRAGVEDPGRGF